MRDVLDDMRKIESGFETWDDDEEHRLEGIQIAKFRGKGAPKKKWEANSEYIKFILFEFELTLCSVEKERQEEVDSSHIAVTTLIDMIPCMKTLNLSVRFQSSSLQTKHVRLIS